MKKENAKKWDMGRLLAWSAIGILSVILVFLFCSRYTNPFVNSQIYATSTEATAIITLPPPFVVTHMKTPEPLKALYMTSWVGGNEKLRLPLIDLIDTTELNAIVIDVKDYTGRISFAVENPKLKEFNSSEDRISDIKKFIGRLHEKGIYVIGRISTFQDSFLVKTHPEYAVKTQSGEVWKDFKGISWLDVGAKPVWDYITLIGDEAYSMGFDELNFDYVRFPSDGNMQNIAYPYSQGKVKSEVLGEFFSYLDTAFRPKKIPISVDLFGMTTSNNDDLGIGQILETGLKHFDYVSPMVYPSHYPADFNGYKKPAERPYDVIFYAMTRGVNRALLASTTPLKLRPWLQDFSIRGTFYTSDMIRQEKKATYDSGLTSWMMWNASNRYTASALDSATNVTNTATTTFP